MAYSEYTVTLKNRPEPLTVYHYDSLPSTNATAKELLRGGTRTGVVIAEAQTAGRGRLGRHFFSRSGIFMTLILPSDELSIPATMLTTAAAAAVCRAVTDEDFDARIKWVNDIQINGKKICGILTEAVTEESRTLGYVVGIGINIGSQDFPPEIAETAATLTTGSPEADATLKTRLTEMLIRNMMEAIHESPEALVAYCAKKSSVIGRQIRFFGAREGVGTATGLDTTGGLVVNTADGEIVLTGGEISVRTI